MVSEYPKSDKAPHGTYWLGKCLNAMNMHESAVNVLSEGVQKFLMTGMPPEWRWRSGGVTGWRQLPGSV